MKRTKYEQLVIKCCTQGWKARCMPIEVGCRGFLGNSLHKASTLGITGVASRRAIKTTTKAAEKALRWLWIQGGDPWEQASATCTDKPQLCHLGEGI